MSDALKGLLEGYLDEDEQATELGKTVRTLRGWRKKREGPPWTKNGKQVFYHRDWTRDWLAAGKQLPVRERRRVRPRAGQRQGAVEATVR